MEPTKTNTTATATPISKTYKTGIDVSSNNGLISWDKVKQYNDTFPIGSPDRISFVYIKANEGVGYDDKKDTFNAQGAKRIGALIGFYHFATITSSEVIKDSTDEATYFLNSLKNLPTGDLPPVLDIETNKADLNPTQILQWINNFISIVKRVYPTVVLYSYTPFLDEHLPAKHGLGNVPLWIAQYTTAPKPRLPKEWTDYHIWQYSNQGKIDGIVGNVDMNRMKI